MTLRVAFVLSALQAGGAERVVADLSRAAVAKGWQLTVITFDRPDDPIYHPLDPAVALRRLGLPSGGRGPTAFLRVARRVRALRGELRSGRYDVVVSFLTKVNTLALIAKLGIDIPVIVSERNNAERQGAHRLWNIILGRLYPRAAAIVMQTERSRERLGQRARDRAVVIPNPGQIPRFSPNFAGPPTLTAVGRLTHQKGFDLLIEAFARIAAQFPEWRLKIWGEGPDRAALEQQVRTLGLEERISLPGTSASPGEWLIYATVFVLSSRYEGWPNVLAEAMASGLPVVAFDCDFGPADMITQEVDGFLVSAEDVDALVNVVTQLIQRPELRARIGEEAKKSVSQFDPVSIQNIWLHLIAENAKHLGTEL